MVDLFHGQYRSQVHCPRCQHKSATFEPFMHLPLPLPTSVGDGDVQAGRLRPGAVGSGGGGGGRGGGAVTVDHCLRLFLREERLGADNCWRCPQCEQPVEALKRLGLWRLPDVLVLHLKVRVRCLAEHAHAHGGCPARPGRLALHLVEPPTRPPAHPPTHSSATR